MLKIFMGPRWVTLCPGVRAQVRPMERAFRVVASHLVGKLHPETSESERGETYSIAIAEQAIIDWDGLGDEHGEPLAVTPENIAHTFRQSDQVLAGFDAQYILPAIRGEEAEKNVSSGSLNGTSAAGRTTAVPAAQKPAPPARTASKPRKRKPARSSGK